MGATRARGEPGRAAAPGAQPVAQLRGRGEQVGPPTLPHPTDFQQNLQRTRGPPWLLKALQGGQPGGGRDRHPRPSSSLAASASSPSSALPTQTLTYYSLLPEDSVSPGLGPTCTDLEALSSSPNSSAHSHPNLRPSPPCAPGKASSLQG